MVRKFHSATDKPSQIIGEGDEDADSKSRASQDAEGGEMVKHVAHKDKNPETWGPYLTFIDDLVSAGLIQAVSTRCVHTESVKVEETRCS